MDGNPQAPLDAGAPSPTPESTKGVDRVLQAHKEAAANGFAPVRKNIGGRPRKDGSPAQPRGAVPVATQPPAAVQALFNEENTGRIIGLPFTLAAVGSGWNGWRLDALEQKELAVTGSIALNEWVRADPKWVALLLFSVSLAGIATAKAIEFDGVKHALKIKAKEEADRQARENPPPKAPVPFAPPPPPPTPGTAAKAPQPQEKSNADASGPEAGFVAGPTQTPPTV